MKKKTFKIGYISSSNRSPSTKSEKTYITINSSIMVKGGGYIGLYVNSMGEGGSVFKSNWILVSNVHDEKTSLWLIWIYVCNTTIGNSLAFQT